MTKHLLTINDLKAKEILGLIKQAKDIKKRPKMYNKALKDKVLLTFFQMPSLRTKVSFAAGMMTLGGSVIDYNAEMAPWSKGKESIEDVGEVLSRYVDGIMVRMHEHDELAKLAKHASVPVINGLTSFSHPCQILSDLLTISEKKKKIKGLNVAFFGDGLNNVTHSLMFAASMLKFNLKIACPNKKSFMPDPEVVRKVKNVVISSDVRKVASNADVVYTDSWMSYRVSPKEKQKRMKVFKKFQVNKKVMSYAKKDAIFMHDLPGLRGMEVSAEVMDSKQSVIYDQAENRMHMQKAILLHLLR